MKTNLLSQFCFHQSDVIEVDENKPVVTVFDPMNAELGSLEIEYVFDLKEEKE